jgi:recombinational DNA repair protein RecT
MASTQEGNVKLSEADTDPTHKHGSRHSLSKYGQFNQNAKTSNGAISDDEYGEMDPEFKAAPVKKILKKSLSKYGGRSIEKIEPTVEAEEDYGNVDPNYRADKVLLSPSGQFTVLPSSSKKATPKQEVATNQATPARSVLDSDDDSRLYSSNQKTRRPLSSSPPKHSAYVFEDARKLSFRNDVQVNSDEEDYGPVDPNYKADPVKVTNSGHITTVNSEKGLKKTLSRYGGPSSDRAPILKQGKSGGEDNEDYGEIDPFFKPDPVALTQSGHYTVLTGTPAEKGLKKTLSKYGSPSTGLATAFTTTTTNDDNNNKKTTKEEDEDYGEIDPTFHTDPVTKTKSGRYDVVPESTTTTAAGKGLKKTLSKYDNHSSENVAKPHGAAFSGLSPKKEEDEEYGDIDPTFHPDPVAKTQSGRYEVVPEDQKTAPKTMKKTLSKYKETMSLPLATVVSPTTEAVKKANDDDNEDYGNDIDPNYLESDSKKVKK